MSFKNIVGNEKAKVFLNKAVDENHILHSYLFSGIDGIGKTLFAREFARKLLCLEKEEEETCFSCQKYHHHNHPDFYEIEPENNSIKIEQIRQMQEKIMEKPITSIRKVYLIIDSDTMTKEAQNCLLKTLEEPPEYATIILTTSNESKLLNTIKSRCMKVSFEPISELAMQEYFKNTMQIEPKEEWMIKSQGSIGKAIKLQEEKETYEKIDALLEKIGKQDQITAFKEAEILYEQKEKIQEILEYINVSLYHTKEKEKWNCIPYVEQTKKRLLASSNYDMCIDYLVMNMWEEMNEKYSRRSI